MLLDSKYMAAVSGGPDSMAMLDTYRNQIDCVVHINYNLRPTAARDEKIVRAYCAKHNLSYKILNVSDIIHAYYNLKFPNQEEALRELRYDYFDHISKITNNNRVLTGHNLNDYVETAIMQYNSNRHEYGFLGMRSITNHHNVTIIRPFLFIPKNDLIDYCNRRILEFGYDETNADPKFKRNAIRQQIQN
jgi:tRNA(Ile)-lysidine synthase